MKPIILATLLILAGGAASAATEDEARASIGDTRLTAGDVVLLDEPIEGNAFAAGARVEVLERVDRSAFVSGGDVTVAGSVGRNLYAAGGDVRLEGEVEGDVRAAGGKVRMASGARIDGDASFAGGSIDVDGEIGAGLRAYGESIFINGRVGGDVEAAGERIRIGPDARIEGRVEYRSSRDIQVDPQAQIAGGISELQKDRRWLRKVGHGAAIVGGITISLGMVLLGALLILAMPRFSREAASTIRQKPWQSLGLGCIMLVGLPFAIIVLLVTVIGIPLALLLVFGYVVLMLLGYLVAAIFVGDSVLERIGGGRIGSLWWRALFLFLALIAIAIVKQLPVVGDLIVLLLFIAGIGAFTMRSWQGFRLEADSVSR
ncbi:MAG: bactofilin family protein [Steroidobacteraceae bacterium]